MNNSLFLKFSGTIVLISVLVFVISRYIKKRPSSIKKMRSEHDEKAQDREKLKKLLTKSKRIRSMQRPKKKH